MPRQNKQYGVVFATFFLKMFQSHFWPKFCQQVRILRVLNLSRSAPQGSPLILHRFISADQWTVRVLGQNVNTLEKFGINPKRFRNHPELDALKPRDLEGNIKLLKNLKIDESAIVELAFKQPAFVFKCVKACMVDQKKHGENRIQYLSDQLEISQQDLCTKLVKYKFVLSMSLKRIKTLIKILKDNNVEPADILSDMWILRSRVETVASRLDKVREADVEVVKPWMGRCEKEIFDGFMTRAAIKQKLLGEMSQEEYISHRLECSASEIRQIIKREPQLQHASVVKIKKILDFLLSNGFTAKQILAGLSRVANRRIETLHARLQELNQISVAPSLYILCKSKREYQYYINRKKKAT